jgi:hypothetical protein
MKHALVASLLCSLTAHAADLPCGPVEKGTIQLDGLTDDWNDVNGIDAGGRDANLSFTVKCNVDDANLWLLVDVRDNYYVRTNAAKPGEDHLAVSVGGKRFNLWPGNAAAIKDKVVPPVKGMKLASALQSAGWAVELAIPLRQLPGFKPGAPSLNYSITAADCDSRAALKTERTVDTSGSLMFAEGTSAIESFLKERNLKRSDVFFDKPVSLGRAAGARVIMAGRYAAAISDGYVFVELPFKSRSDLKDARVIDLAGDGRHALVLRYVERGGSGARELVAVYRFGGDTVQRVFAAETAKSQGANRIDDKVSYVRRGKATDILIEAGAATGFSAESYKESPAEDVIPILLPWGDDRKARYQFRGDEYLRQ